jgi:beta-phosphoglucomutase family hydrolase
MQGAIFDFDGVIIDSCPLHGECWKRISENLKKPFSWEIFLRGFGVKNERFIKEMLKWSDDSKEISQIIDQKEKLFHELLKKEGVLLVEGTLSLIRQLKKGGIPCAIGSSAIVENIEIVFSYHKELAPLFDAIVTADDVSVGKPDPEVFLIAAERLQIEPTSCVVFEDAPLGIEAALRAGMKSVALTTTFPKEVLQAAKPDLLVDSLDDFLVLELFASDLS